MSLFRKIFKGKTFEEECAEGDARFAGGDPGLAKLAFERALAKGNQAPVDARALVEDKIARCCDRLAEARLEIAESHRAAAEVATARAEAISALETARDPVLRQKIQALLDGMEQEDARDFAEPARTLSKEESLLLLAGGWEDDQAQEYATYGAAFEDAMLDLNDGHGDRASPALEAILSSAPDPHYLWLEVARARHLVGNTSGAQEAFRKFLASIGPDEGGDARLSAHIELARIADEQKDFEGAVAELEAAMEALSGDYRPFLLLGRLLRTQGHAEEAVEVLENAVSLLDENQPDWFVHQELGLALADAGETQRAIASLEAVIDLFARRQALDFPITSAVPLAKLQEKAGNRERAADLYRALTHGSDVANHLLYHREAARLLREIGLNEEARRMLLRAEALAQSPEEKAAVAGQLVGL